jgi:hypothetical protein
MGKGKKENAQDTGEVDVVGVKGTDGHDLLSLDDGHLGRASHGAREVLSGVATKRVKSARARRGEEKKGKQDAPEDTVSVLVRLPNLDEGVVTLDRLLHDVTLAIERPLLPRLTRDLNLLSALLVLDGDVTGLHSGSVTGGSVEGGDTGSSSAAALGEGTLGGELEGDLAVEVEGFEVLSMRKR